MISFAISKPHNFVVVFPASRNIVFHPCHQFMLDSPPALDVPMVNVT
jgi:hypothetical protein